MQSILKKKKIISLLLLISLLTTFSPIFTNKAKAQDQAASAAIFTTASGINAACFPLAIGTGFVCDPGVRFNTLMLLQSSLGIGPGVAMKEQIWDSIAYFAGRVLVRQISQSIVNWINSGFQGNPSFVQNFPKFMADTVDRTIGEFIFASDLKFLCDPFETNIRINLGLAYSPFKDKINCTMSEVLQNIDGSMTGAYEDFMNGDFINGGGWDSWLDITTVPQNNQLGAMMIAQGELDARIGDIKLDKENELNWSGGLLSMKNCTRTTTDSNGTETKEEYRGDPAFFEKVGTTEINDYDTNFEDGQYSSTLDECTVVTPGVWITGTGNKVLGMDLDRLGAADEINEIVGALANFVISKAMEKGMAMIKGEELSPANADWRAGISQLQSQQNNDIYSAGSNSNYQPNYGSYSGIGTTNDATITSAKNELKNYITSITIPEQAYFDAYNSVYTAASVTELKFTSVINCYTTKLNSTNPTLTSSERSIANAQIDIASSTARELVTTKNYVSSAVLASETNLNNLQTITANVDRANSMAALTTEQTNLVNLLPSLHTQVQATEAMSVASTTLSQIAPKSTTADTMKTACDAFPTR
jgi:hypothetical protein